MLCHTRNLLAAVAVLFFCLQEATPLAVAESLTIYRDDFGVPHVYAETMEGAAFGIGYAQAEDRLEELLKNYRKAAGTMSEAFGEDYFRHDYRQRMWQHERIAREKFSEVNPKVQATCKAYIRGVKKFMDDHPEQVPDWAPELHDYNPVMLSRYIIWGWPEGQAAGDLSRGGVRPDPVAYRGSNEWLISGDRTQDGAVIACIDPHLGWYGEFRFYEQRMYAPKDGFACSGACILGVPMPGLGHNEYLSVAMTTGGPDTADVYVETVNPENAKQYKVDDDWREMTTLTDTIRVKTDDGINEQDVSIDYTHHGPVVARKDGQAYTMALAYFDELGLMDELYNVFTSKNLEEAKEALSTRQLMPQNIMIGTVDGDMFYVRTGRVPIRNHEHPTDHPIPGDVSHNDWAGIHPFEDLVQITNPPQGYMQNCNISPAVMMKESPLLPDNYKKPYLYQADTGPAHQRAQMALEILAANDSFSVEEAIDLAFCPQVLGGEAWQERISQAWGSAAADVKTGDTKSLYDNILGWNRRSDPESVGALSFHEFKRALKGHSSRVDVPQDLGDTAIIEALQAAAKKLREEHGRMNVRFGDVYRVGRDGSEKTYPVGGGTLRSAGMATPRAISFGKRGELYVGRGGQTSTQIVVLTKPPRSYMVLPLGESDHRDSPHWDDQAAKLFSSGRVKDTFFMDLDGLRPHVTSETSLDFN